MAENTAESGRTETTTDHDAIQEWVEGHGSTAAQVSEPVGDDPGSLAVVPTDIDDDSVDLLSWDEFFEIFEDEELAFVYQTDKDDPDEQWFCKFIHREEEPTDDIFENENAGTTWSAGQQYEERASEDSVESTETEIDSSGEPTIEEGQTAETEVTRTEVVEKEIVETDQIQSRVVASEITGQSPIDSSVIDRELDHCEMVDNETVESEVMETRRVTEEIFETYTVESEVTDSETVERDLGDDDSPTEPDEAPTEEAAVDLEDSGLTRESILGSEIVQHDIGESDLIEGSVVESEVIERRVIENEVAERFLLRAQIESGESIDSQVVESEIVESEIVERETADRATGTPVNDEQGDAGDLDSDTEATGTMGETDTDSETGESAGATGTGAGVNITEDEEGKSVVNTYGDEIGIVTEVREDVLYVDPDPGMTEKITSSLGWGDSDDDDVYPIEANQIETITDDDVKISQM
jgi:hypothetical protein